MTRFSANLGFLWTDRPLPDAIHAAAAAGFDAVECHWPYDIPPGDIRAALAETGLAMLGLNTRRGNVTTGEMGLAALPDTGRAAKDAIEEAVDYARSIAAHGVHIMAGNAAGEAAETAFVDNLRYAARIAPELTLLIEPLNATDAPEYFLRTTDQAAGILARVGAANLRLMFDCYHVARTEGQVIQRLTALLPVIGHIQIAGVPDRGPPDRGDLDYRAVFAALDTLGWTQPVGAEYRPDGTTDQSLGWMTSLSN